MQPEAGWDTFVAQLDLMQEDWLENLDIRSSKTWAEQGAIQHMCVGMPPVWVMPHSCTRAGAAHPHLPHRTRAPAHLDLAVCLVGCGIWQLTVQSIASQR